MRQNRHRIGPRLIVAGMVILLLLGAGIVALVSYSSGNGNDVLVEEGGKTDGKGGMLKPVLSAGKQSKDGVPSPPADPRRDKAVRRGLAYLRSKVPDAFDPNESHLGELALLGLTLLECGAPADDPDVQKLARILRSHASDLNGVYRAAPTLWFLDRLHKNRQISPEDLKLMQTLGLRLVAGQTEELDLWGYETPRLDETAREKLYSQLRERRPREGYRGEPDLSNTQFAALGLWRAGLHDIPVEDALIKAAASIRAHQNRKTGTWAYSIVRDVSNRDTGTCVGLILLALGQSFQKPDRKFLEDPQVAQALDHLAEVIRNPKNRVEPGKSTPAELKIGRAFNPQGGRFDADGDLYFLWTLERTALILNQETIRGEDWYAWGSEFIYANQLEDGSWQERHKGIPDTCFALLFLSRGNLFSDLTDKLQLSLADAVIERRLG